MVAYQSKQQKNVTSRFTYQAFYYEHYSPLDHDSDSLKSDTLTAPTAPIITKRFSTYPSGLSRSLALDPIDIACHL
jgi:hypothetical protein